MLRNALFSLLILIVGKSYAQDYFVLIQADNSQPFYVKLGDKSLSSTIKGRLILSQLKGGSHRITVGFPKQVFPEQQFSFNIDDKDLEFQLKDLGEKGWGLFNPQTSELKTADKKEVTSNSHNEGIKKDDAFSRLMAGVVSDTAVMYNTYAMEAVLKDSPIVKSTVQKDSPATTTIRIDTTATVAAPPAPLRDSTVSRPARPSTPLRPIGTVVKLSERKTPKGLRLAFADRPNGRKADIIIVIIPMDSLPARQVVSNKPDSTASAGGLALNKPDSSVPGGVLRPARADSNQTTSAGELFRPKADSVVAPPVQTIVRNDPDTIHVYLGPARKEVPPARGDTAHTSAGKLTHSKPDSSHNPSVVTHSAPTTNRELFRNKPDSPQAGAVTKPLVVNSDCRDFASDYDVDKLRVKLLEISKDEDRILTARKVFKTKCFTTKQIRALSEVYTTDAGKYRFFEAAYPFVSDDHFRELTDLLADPVYNGKFRAMTGQR